MVDSNSVLMILPNGIRTRSNLTLSLETSLAICASNLMLIQWCVLMNRHSGKERMVLIRFRRFLPTVGDGCFGYLRQIKASEWWYNAYYWYLDSLSTKGKKRNIKVCVNLWRNDVVRALEKTYVLGNVSVIDGNYVCTVPLELNNQLSLLLDLANRYGFISARLLAREKKWTPDEFDHNIRDLRTKGVLWIDKQSPNNPHFYFLSHLGSDFSKFADFMRQFWVIMWLNFDL